MKKQSGFLGIILAVIVGIFVVSTASAIFYFGKVASSKKPDFNIKQNPVAGFGSFPSPSPLPSPQPSPTLDTQNTTNWQTYTDPTYHYSVKYPPDLTLKLYPPYSVAFLKNGNYATRISVDIDYPNNNSYPQILAMKLGEKKEIIAQTLWFERNGDIGIGGEIAKFYDFEVIIPDAVVKLGPSTAKVFDSKLDPGKKISTIGKTFIIVKNGQVYSIGVTLGEGSDPQLEQELIGMAATFKFTN